MRKSGSLVAMETYSTCNFLLWQLLYKAWIQYGSFLHVGLD